MKRVVAWLGSVSLGVSLGACAPATPPVPSPVVDAREMEAPEVNPEDEAGPPRFVVVATLDSGVKVFAVEGGVFFASTFNLKPHVAMGIAAPDGASYDPSLVVEQVDATMSQVLALFGRHPDDLHLVDVEAGGAVPVLHHRRLRDGRWQVVDQRLARGLAGVAELARGTLALTTHFFAGSGEPPAFWTITGNPPALQLQGPEGCPAQSDGARHGALVAHEAFGATRAGTIIAYGLRCGAEPAVEIWRPGETSSQVVALPHPARDDDHFTSGVVAGPDDQAWVHGRGLWHYDGATWRVVAPPVATAPIVALAASSRQLWAIAGGGVFRHDGAWQPAELPPEIDPESLAVTEEGDVWLGAQDKLLRLVR